VLGTGNELDVGDDETPVDAGRVRLGQPALHLAAGRAHTCALLVSGAVRCWGAGQYGRLGYANEHNVGDKEWPGAAGDVDVGGPANLIAAGGFHTCAVLTDGCVRCWGLGENGQLGYGNTNSVGDDEVPSAVGCVQIF
jgi:alpha-tubulin suppressor-like RCC1 family protein